MNRSYIAAITAFFGIRAKPESSLDRFRKSQGVVKAAKAVVAPVSRPQLFLCWKDCL
jgi:hypothetical protein